MIKTTMLENESNRMLVRKLTKGGGITIPVAFRKEMGFENKDMFTVEMDETTGDILLRRISGKCILTGKTDNLVMVNGKYISMSALVEIQGQLTGEDILEEIIPDDINSRLLTKKLNEIEKEKIKNLKRQIEREIGIDKENGETLEVKSLTKKSKERETPLQKKVDENNQEEKETTLKKENVEKDKETKAKRGSKKKAEKDVRNQISMDELLPGEILELSTATVEEPKETEPKRVGKKKVEEDVSIQISADELLKDTPKKSRTSRRNTRR